ncbi:MAG: ParB/RepB/Spo0J family partition protein [Gammaproteobacteria bacterium]|nr:ParB/RepB/Spo0J family partition protein [Gammaproteobacteria bacterium]
MQMEVQNIHDLSAQELFALARERTLEQDEIAHAHGLLNTLLDQQKTSPLKTPQMIQIERLKALLDSNKQSVTMKDSQSGFMMEPGLEQVVQDKNAVLIPYDQIDIESNPREVFLNIDELAESIKNENGLNNPIVVLKKPDGRFTLVGGGRRYRAWGALIKDDPIKWALIPARLKKTDQLFLAQLFDNKHREELQPVEEAKAFQRCMEEFGFSQKNLAQKLSISTRYVSDTLALLKLPKSIQTKINEGEIGRTSRQVKRYLDAVKKGQDIHVDHDLGKGSLAFPPVSQSGDTKQHTKPAKGRQSASSVRQATIEISKNTALSLCELLAYLSGAQEGVLSVEGGFNEKTPKKEIKTLLEMRAHDILMSVKK